MQDIYATIPHRIRLRHQMAQVATIKYKRLHWPLWAA